MSIKKRLSTFFYCLQLLHTKNTLPKVYWGVYFLTVIQTFFGLHIDRSPILFELSNTLVKPQNVLSQTGVFIYMMIMIGIQIVGKIALVYIARNSNIKKSATVETLLKLLFWVSFVNDTLNLGMVSGFEDNRIKNSCQIVFSLLYVFNMILFNFTLESKRIWAVNQMFFLDLLRVILLWVNGSKFLISFALIVYLLVAISMAFFRPIFHMSSQNKYVQLVTSKTIVLCVVALMKIFSSSSTLSSIPMQMLGSLASVFFVFHTFKMYLNYNIRKLYSQPKVLSPLDLQKQERTNDDYLLLLFMEENFEEYKNEIKLYMIHHYRNCTEAGVCKCGKVFQSFFGKVGDPNSNEYETNLQSSDIKTVESKNKHIALNELNQEIKDSFSFFVLSNLSNFLQEQTKFSSSQNQSVKQSQLESKQLSFVQRRQIHKNFLNLQYIKIKRLSCTTKNLNLAYLQLKSLDCQLKKHKLLSPQVIGILSFLKQTIVEEKQIKMETDTQNTNMFCIQYFNCQKVTNKLQEIIFRAVSQFKAFWNEVKIREPDEKKILSIMVRYNKYHDKIMQIYEQINNQKEKPSAQIKFMYMFYGKILQLEGDHKFFTGDLGIIEKDNDMKNAASLNLRLYSEESNTHVMSFSINEQNFGQMNYASSEVGALIDAGFKNISCFLPDEYKSLHKDQIKRFLESDSNYFRHTVQSPCYLKINTSIIIPVYLETHLMAFTAIGQIELITFFKPIFEDERIMKKGGDNSLSSEVENDLVVCCDDDGKLICWTDEFGFVKNRMFEEKQIQEVMKPQLITQLQEKEFVFLQLQDSDYELRLIKKIPLSENKSKQTSKHLYFIQFIDTIERSMMRSGTNCEDDMTFKKSFPSSGTFNLSKNKTKKAINVKGLLLKALDNQLTEVHKFDSLKERVSKIWKIAFRPEKGGFIKRMLILVICGSGMFALFMILTTVFSFKKKDEFIEFSNFLQDFTDIQVSIVQSMTYLREININLFTGVTQKLPMVPAIVEQVNNLSGVVYDSMNKLGSYLVGSWLCVDVLDSGQKVLRNEKAYSTLNNYVLNSITNLVEKERKNSNALNFSPIQSQAQLPYNTVQSNFIKLISNGVGYVIPAQQKLRQTTINSKFYPEINEVTNKPFFFIPLVGFVLNTLLLVYFVFNSLKLSKLAVNSLGLFEKFKVEFAQRKLQSVERHEQSMNGNNEIYTKTNLETSNKFSPWNQLNNILSNKSTKAFSNFIVKTMKNTNNNDQVVPPKPSKKPRESIALPVSISENTDRELVDDELATVTKKKRVPQRRSFQVAQNYLGEEDAVVEPEKVSATKGSDERLEFGRSSFIPPFYQKLGFFFILVPTTIYFTHIFLFTLEYNRFMESVLKMKNQLLYRREALTYFWNYQYELGLFEGGNSFSNTVITALDTSYLSEKKISLVETETDKFLFAKMNNYKRANGNLMYGNICEHLDMLGVPQPSFGATFTKQECETVFDGVLQNGYKQSYINFLQTMRTLTTEYKTSQLLSPQQRFAYLKDARVVSISKAYPYMLMVSKYIDEEFSKDFDGCIKFYQTFMILDMVIMALLCPTSIVYYLWVRKIQADKELAMIKCSFLLIGNKKFLDQPAILTDDKTRDDGNRYFFLE